jgi:hypothetical protein
MLWFLWNERTRWIPLIFTAVGSITILGAIWRLIAETGEQSASLLCAALVYLGYWPFFVVSPFLKDQQLASNSNICVSILGWTLLGVVVAEIKARMDLSSDRASR